MVIEGKKELQFMTFLGRAYYNLVHLADSATSHVEEWEKQNYRTLKISDLFDRLQRLSLKLDVDQYLALADSCDSPEDLVELLLKDEKDPQHIRKVYLVIFELWRRLCKDKQSLSIFCDELDFQFQQFEEGEDNVETLQMMLGELENILDQTVDEGESPQEIFQLVSAYLAHNLENFIYELSSDLIDTGNDLIASEIIDGFYEYVQNHIWYDFLRIRLVVLADPKEASSMMQYLLDYLQESPDLDLIYEILRFLTYTEEIPLFYSAFELAVHLINREDQFKKLLEICINYFNSLDEEDKERSIQELLKNRQNLPPDYTVKLDDDGLQLLMQNISSVLS